jgi:DNA-binding Lrp family transcriptional regulator
LNTESPMSKAFVLVNTDLGSEAEVKSELKKLEGIVGAYEVYGVYDLVVEIQAESDQKLKEIIFSKIRTLKHVRSTLTLNTVS